MFAATDLGPWWQNVILAIWSTLTGRERVVFPTPRHDPSFLKFLKKCIQAGEFRAVTDREYSLQNIADAYRYVETEQKAGVVVIRVMQPEDFSLETYTK